MSKLEWFLIIVCGMVLAAASVSQSGGGEYLISAWRSLPGVGVVLASIFLILVAVLAIYLRNKHIEAGGAMSARVEKAIRWFKFAMLVVAVIAGVEALFALGHPNMGNKLAKAIFDFIGGAIFFAGPAFVLGWLTGKDDTAKLDDSKTSAGTPDNAPDPAPIAEAPKIEVRRFDEDAAYSQALREIESGSIDHAVWSRALAEAGGEEAKARANYIKLRVERMRRAK